MKHLLFFACLTLFAISLKAQYIHKIKGDTVLITNDSCSAELNLENSTKSIKGFLYNKGNGRTEFRRGMIKLNDSLYLFGNDTLNLKSAVTLAGLSGINIFNSNGTLTGNRFLDLGSSNFSIGKSSASNFTVYNSGLTWMGNNTPVSNASGLHLNHVVNASSGFAKGLYIKDSLIASANNDLLIGLDVNTVFNANSLTGTFGVDLRTRTANVVFGSNFGYGAIYGNENDGVVQIKTIPGTYKTQLLLRPAGNAGGHGSAWWSIIEQDFDKLTISPQNYGTLHLQTQAISGGIYLGGYSGTSANAVYIPSSSRNVLIGTNNDDSTAILKLVSTTKGFLPPVWTKNQRLAIDGISKGLIGYQSDSTENLYLHKSTGWKRILTQDDQTPQTNYRDSTNLLLTSGSASSASVLSIDLSTYYQYFDIIEIQFYDVKPVTDGAIARIRLSSDGSSYDASANNYRFAFHFNSSANTGLANGGQDTYIPFTGTGSGTDNGSSSTLNGTVKIHSPNNGAKNPVIQVNSNYFNNAGDYCTLLGGGSRSNNQITRGVQLSFHSGNISSASYKVYGRKNN